MPWWMRLKLWWHSKAFKPCVVEWPQAQVTELVLKDCLTVYTPLRIPGVEGHCVDLGYDTDGHLVAVKIWDLVARRKG